ncbi:hypothetical protein [Streptomyces sp. GQFP]|uniref:hypothetical protein n=1 Tax=Streptomyces sp. GQFP TaxID=2907545 RepID=UPI001F43BECC|nr:hypothetical protein [Streptomyces sp. GQFP]UIX30420.1 hypothetical protein LUX31_10460 [Streptomyces sp. GQFP]
MRRLHQLGVLESTNGSRCSGAAGSGTSNHALRTSWAFGWSETPCGGFTVVCQGWARRTRRTCQAFGSSASSSRGTRIAVNRKKATVTQTSRPSTASVALANRVQYPAQTATISRLRPVWRRHARRVAGSSHATAPSPYAESFWSVT